jgi:phosphoglycolate phosphatase
MLPLNILLDLDGTLTDPREGIVQCIKHALAGLGHLCPSDAELERYIGPPLQRSLGALFGGDSAKIAAAIALYRERFSSKGIFENRLYPEIPAALAALRDLGKNLIVATSKPTIFAERIIEHFDLGRLIRAVYGSDLDGTRSDKAELVSYILNAQSISAATTVMVGDRSHDIIGAKANGVVAVGALWGYGSRQELLEAGAAALCERPADLEQVLSLR